MKDNFVDFDSSPFKTAKVLTTTDVEHQSDRFISSNSRSPCWSEISYTIDKHSKTKALPSSATLQGTNILRGKILLLILICLLILIIITIVVIKFTILNSHSTTSEKDTSRTSSYSSTMKPTSTISTIYDVGNGGTSDGSPCTSYTVVNDPSRNIATSGIGGACDNGSLFNTTICGRWIRFVGTGGTIIPLQSPGENHCGAFLAGWFNGTLPTIIGTAVSGEVCFNVYGAVCRVINSVSIVNCDGFYVYFLPPMVMCNARYCTA
ncbi:unnamed protein product [Rotaria magnacalcarata]|uniref:Uncharacterized protein n=1 Tax=Rotaria magnacalcarata TaxID=392030 RepID=A0A816V610_9BILA|nr:unnamed protein product [Rotaria magnacalcarata]CAF3956119.1 unnamed protein product [Rotaria magnacalcarata]